MTKGAQEPPLSCDSNTSSPGGAGPTDPADPADSGPAPTPWGGGSGDHGSCVFCSLSAQPGGEAAHCRVTVSTSKTNGRSDSGPIVAGTRGGWGQGSADRSEAGGGVAPPRGAGDGAAASSRDPLSLCPTHLCRAAEALAACSPAERPHPRRRPVARPGASSPCHLGHRLLQAWRPGLSVLISASH